jgi:hypothetical protein
MAIRPILKTCVFVYLTILSGISGKIIMAEQVRPGYPQKTDPTASFGFLPGPITIEADEEFSFSKWIS